MASLTLTHSLAGFTENWLTTGKMQVTTTGTSSALPVEAEKAHGLAVEQVRRRVGRKNTGIRVGEVSPRAVLMAGGSVTQDRKGKGTDVREHLLCAMHCWVLYLLSHQP